MYGRMYSRAMTTTQITTARADRIRDRFLGTAAQRRAEAEVATDPQQRAALLALAESADRMAQKRYEAMTIRPA
jgi:hypothetical protein